MIQVMILHWCTGVALSYFWPEILAALQHVVMGTTRREVEDPADSTCWEG